MYNVYRIRNLENGKSYIGITSRDILARWREHVERARHGKRESRLYDAIRKYGRENFILTLVDCAETIEKVKELETFYIKYYNTYENGYNCNLGGCGFLEFPEHIKRKISLSQKGKIISGESKRKMSEAKRGDKRCANNFGRYTQKGLNNPKSHWYVIQLPDGSVVCVHGKRDFCRSNNLREGGWKHGKCCGYSILGKFNDYPEREYTQAGGSARLP